jgi:hypothetical protein
MAAVASARSSTTVQSIIVPAGQPPQKPSVVTKSTLGLQRMFFTEKDMTDPSRLYQVIYQIQQFVTNALAPLASNPILTGNIFRNLTFSAGQVQNITHKLGRAFVNFYCVGAQGGPWAGFIPLTHGLSGVPVLPTGVTTSQQIPIQSVNAGVFDFLVY